jgi:hypothetical protein
MIYHGVKDLVSHPYKSTGKLAALYILKLYVLGSWWEERRF